MSVHRSPPTPLLEMIDLTCSRMTEMVREAEVPFGEHLEMASDIEAQNTSLALNVAVESSSQVLQKLATRKTRRICQVHQEK